MSSKKSSTLDVINGRASELMTRERIIELKMFVNKQKSNCPVTISKLFVPYLHFNKEKYNSR